MKQNFICVAEVSSKDSKLISHQIECCDIHHFEHDTNMASYESESSSEATNLHLRKNIDRPMGRRNKARLPYTTCASDVAEFDLLSTPRKYDNQDVMHSKSSNTKSDKKYTNDPIIGKHHQENSERRHVRASETPMERSNQNIEHRGYHKTNKAFSLNAKYISKQDESAGQICPLKGDSITAKGDFFTEIELYKLGFYADDIRWNNLYTNGRRELHPLIHERLCSFTNPDIILMIDEHEFYCHRIVLQCYSPFFDSIKNLESNSNLIKLDKGVSKEAFFAIYAWMLTTGQGGFHYLSRENILQVLIACQILKVSDLEEQCLAFIDNEKAFSEENAFHLFMDASRLGQKTIVDLMVPRIKAFFLHLVSSKDFLELDVEDLTIFLRSNYAIIHCEMEMFMSAVRWLMHDFEERENCLVTVMQCIRFGLMSPPQLVDIRKNPQSPEFLKITEDKTVQKMIDDGMAYSVEKSLSGTKADHLHRCNLLNLDLPEPRNFSKETKDYKTYNEFLMFLQELQKNPRYMYVENNCDLKSDNSDQSFTRTQSQYSLNEDSENEQENLFLEKNQINNTLPSFKMFSSEKRECEIRKFEEWCGPKLFREFTDMHGNKIYQPVAYHVGSETIKLFNNNNDEVIEPFISDNNIINEGISDNREQLKSSKDGYLSKNKDNIETYYKQEIIKTFSPENITGKKLNNTLKKNIKKLSLRENAAIIIQSTYRGFKVRKLLKNINKKYIIDENMKRKLEFKTETFNNFSNDNKLRFNKFPILSNGTLRKSLSSESSLAQISKTNYDIPGSLYFPHYQSILIFGGKNPGCKLTSLNNSSTIYRYIPESNTWETAGFLPKPRYHHATTMLKGKILVIGGSNPVEGDNSENNIYTENWSFDPLTREWGKEPKLLTPRKSFGLVTFHGYMFVIGGQDKDNKILSSVERYDPSQKKWEEVTPLPEPLIYPAVCVYKNNIWIAGGLNSYPKPVVSSQVYCYDPFKNLWNRSAPLRFGRGFSTLINYDGLLHLIGGAVVKNDELFSTDSIDVWDDKLGKWKLKSNMSIPRHGHVVAILGNQMLMIGGSTTKYIKSLNQVDVWCIKTGTWNRQISSLPVPVVGHSLITLPPSTQI